MFIPLGAEADELEHKTPELPYATIVLVTLCVIIHLAVRVPLEDFERVANSRAYGYLPGHPLSFGLFTYQFLHADWVHLLGNMLFLLSFGSVLERHVGHVHVLAFYLATGCCSAWMQGLCASPIHGLFKVLHIKLYVPLIGASGAIMGLMGAIVPIAPKARIRVLMALGNVWRLVVVPAWGVGCLFLLEQFVLAAMQDQSSGGVAYTAHVGGLLSGAFLAFLALPFLGEREVRPASLAVAGKPLAARAPVAAGAGRGPAAHPPMPAGQPPAIPSASPGARAVSAPLVLAAGTAASAGAAHAARPVAPIWPTHSPAAMPSEPPAPLRATTPAEPPAPLPAAAPAAPPTSLPPVAPSALPAPLPAVAQAPLSSSSPRLEPAEVARVAAMVQAPDADDSPAHDLHTHVGSVPLSEDVDQVSGSHARSIHLAQVQHNLRRALSLEKNPAKLERVVAYYRQVLNDRQLPGGHRAYAGLRLARMHLDNGDPRTAAMIAEKLLCNALPPKLHEDLTATYRQAVEALGATPPPDPQQSGG